MEIQLFLVILCKIPTILSTKKFLTFYVPNIILSVKFVVCIYLSTEIINISKRSLSLKRIIIIKIIFQYMQS